MKGDESQVTELIMRNYITITNSFGA